MNADSIQREIESSANQQGQFERDLQASKAEEQRLQASIRQALTALGIGTASDEAALRATFTDYAELMVAEIPTLERDLEAARNALHHLLTQQQEQAEALGLAAESVLDAQECAAEAERLAQEIRIKEQATRIVSDVRDRMIEKVLPNTTANMCLLLPLLTLDRYRDCEITPDYKLRIWDEQAGRYVAKNIFSGGTRDQFSLALRLAFALASLPQELGTTPGFIFLDEPLSSFDSPRSEALVNLLTRGQIHANFPQIFVISHNLMFDPHAFSHHLRLEDGMVIESTLGPVTAAATEHAVPMPLPAMNEVAS